MIAGIAAMTLLMITGPTPPTLFGGEFRVELVRDGYWNSCDLVITVQEAGTGTLELSCKLPEAQPPRSHINRSLTPEEIQNLRSLLTKADLFKGEFSGWDGRGIDLDLTTLRIESRGRVGILVC